jgi:hypothetical protein
MPAHRITDSEFLSLPTPTTRDFKDGSQPHERDGIVQTDTLARAVFNSGEVSLPTPTVSDTYTDNLKSSQQRVGSMHSVTLPQAVRMVAVELEGTEPPKTTPPQTDNSTIGIGHSIAEDRQ